MKKIFIVAAAFAGLSALELKAQLYVPIGSPSVYGTGIRVGIGPGANTQSSMLHVKTNVLNDGIKVEQTNVNGGAAMLSLWHTSASLTNGHNWSLISTSSPGNTQGAGKLLFYDYTAGGPYNNRMQIDANGNVGIGSFLSNANPQMRLHVKTVTPNDGMRIEQNASTGSAIVGLYNTSPGAKNWSLNATGAGSADGNGNFLLRNETSGLTNLFVSGSTGNIGIGTTNPQGGRLHVYTDNGSGLCVEHNVSYDYDFAVKVRVNRDQTKAFSIINSGTEVMTIWGTGVINTPKLYAEEIQVVPTAGNNPWPDYVFAPNYQLMPLDSVETYYTANNHLPGVPSQDEVQQNGINVYDMNAVLLQKIEELTMYVVEQQKQIDAMKEEKSPEVAAENK